MRTAHREKRVVWTAALVVSAAFFFFFSLSGPNASASPKTTPGTALPRMIDLGRNQCMPCRMMAPVLAELKETYAGVIDIEYINIAENPGVMEKLGLPVRAIPFQIFYDASGKVVKRHYGYMSREEIVKTFRELGFDTKGKTKDG